jgi:acetyl/propionyl-CoA carboxylase alpha subunit
VFVGPPAAVIEAMGSKTNAKRTMAAAGVPVVPGAELDATTDVEAAGRGVGLPLLVKASAGGGGRGMRVVRSLGELAEAIAGASAEAAASFGDPAVFLERYLESPHHVEIQVLADTHGNAVHLFERECSIQRRHQKVVEEAPSPNVDAELRRAMGEVSVRAALATGYRGAGTLEYLVVGDEFFFLEMNTRIQVEHPVTEAVTGLDLVELQLRIARGEALSFAQSDVRLDGHAIEARLYAEDPAAGYLPTTGRFGRFALEHDSVRVDAAIEDGSEVTPFYDGLLAKVVAHASDRRTATDVLVRALAGAELHGPATNRDHLVRVLAGHEFAAGDTSTEFLDQHPHLIALEPDVEIERAHLVAATLVMRHHRRVGAPVLAFAPAGWRNVPSGPATAVYELGGDERVVAYRPAPAGDGTVRVDVDGMAHVVDVLAVDDDGVDFELDGERHRAAVNVDGDVAWVNGDGRQHRLVVRPRFADTEASLAAGGPTAPMPGTVVTVAVAVGERVSVGAVLVVLEAMKVQHRIVAALDGVVDAVHVEPGDRVEAHQVLVTLRADE